MTGPGTARVVMFYRAECPLCPEWKPEERKDSGDAHGDRRLHDLGHIVTDVTPKKGGRR